MVSFTGNLLGSLFYIVIVHFGAIVNMEPYAAGTVALANAKVIEPTWITVFIRAIGCNWLICLAVYMSFLSKTVVSKIICIYIPIFTFVAVGFDNSVANMFMVPVAMINGAQISVWMFIWKCLLPSTLGNIVGGGVFVGMFYWYLYVLDLSNEEKPPILPTMETSPMGQINIYGIDETSSSRQSTSDEVSNNDTSNPRSNFSSTLNRIGKLE